MPTSINEFTCLRCLQTASAMRVPRGSFLVTVALIVLGVGAVAATLLRFLQDQSTSGHSVGFGELLIALAVGIVPAFGYEVWRRARQHAVCGGCRGRDVVPADSPRAAQVRQQAQPTSSRNPVPEVVKQAADFPKERWVRTVLFDGQTPYSRSEQGQLHQGRGHRRPVIGGDQAATERQVPEQHDGSDPRRASYAAPLARRDHCVRAASGAVVAVFLQEVNAS
jgi:hypothetical protein